MRYQNIFNIGAICLLLAIMQGCNDTSGIDLNQFEANADHIGLPLNDTENLALANLENLENKIDDDNPTYAQANYALKLAQPATIHQSQMLIHRLQLKQDLNPKSNTIVKLAQAQIALYNSQPGKAWKILKRCNTDQLPDTLKAYLFELKAQTNIQFKSYHYALTNRLLAQQYMPTDDQSYIHKIWQVANLMSSRQINSVLHNNAFKQNPQIIGWAKLAKIAHNSNKLSPKWSSSLEQWQQAYPTHLANLLIPKAPELGAITDTNAIEKMDSENWPNANKIKKIGILLPMHGSLGKVGGAIQKGIFTAHYQNKFNKKQRISLHTYDTSQRPIDAILAQASHDHMDVLVGPLTKAHVNERINDTEYNIPTLALNYINDQNYSNNKVVQFDLSKNSEAQMIAYTLYLQGYRHPLVISQTNNSGQSTKEAFINTWPGSKQDISIYNIIEGQPVNATNKNMRNLLGIDASNARSHSINSIAKKPLRFLPRRRNDVDAIFLSLNNKYARQINPLIHYYFAGNLPIYATSNVLPIHASSYADHDLNGIRLLDSPWILHAEQDKNAQILVHKDFAHYKRFVGIGMDAYTLSLQMSHLQRLPIINIKGKIGNLQLNNKGVVNRQLTWVNFHNGAAKLLKIRQSTNYTNNI